MGKLNGGFINGATPNQMGPQQETAALELASLGLFFCMVVTLMGIKIWWFRHRLTFDHSSSTTTNGMASGNQSYDMSLTRTKNRSSKDKRIPQQFRDPVMIHGVFRKRHEDDFDGVERRKLLSPEDTPYCHRKFPQSLPLLFHDTPRNNNNSSRQQVIRIDDQLKKIPAPPLRDPPTPPIIQDLLTHQSLYEAPKRPGGSYFPTPLSRNPSTQSIQKPSTYIREVKPTTKAAIITSSISQLKLNSITHQANLVKGSRRASGESDYHPELIVDKDSKSAFKIGHFETPTEPKSINPLKRNKSENVEITESAFLKAKTIFMNSKPNTTSLNDRRGTGYERPKVLEWHVETYEEPKADKNNKLRKWKDLQSYNDDDEEMMKQMQSGLKEGVDNNEKGVKVDQLWQEMEQEIRADFTDNIEDDFNKIKNSYGTNEKRFVKSDTGYGKTIEEDWENFEKLAIEKDKSNLKEQRPTGYVKRGETEQRQVHFNLIETDAFDIDSNSDENDEFQSRASRINERRPTGFVRIKDLNELHIKLYDSNNSDNDNENKDDKKNNAKSQNDNDIDDYGKYEEFRNIKSSKLKQRRPTGFVSNSEEIIDQLVTNYKAEEVPSSSSRSHTKKSKVSFQLDNEELSESESEEDELSTLMISANKKEHTRAEYKRKTKPNQKVRFFKSWSSSSSDEADAKVEPRWKKIQNKKEGVYGELPHQCITKIMYKKGKKNISQTTTNKTTTATDLEAVSCYSDSWSAIQKQRQLTKEFQKIDLREHFDTDTLRPHVIYRNSLANSTNSDVRQTQYDTSETRKIKKTKPQNFLLEQQECETTEA